MNKKMKVTVGILAVALSICFLSKANAASEES